jgi:hypothetical protein
MRKSTNLTFRSNWRVIKERDEGKEEREVIAV